MYIMPVKMDLCVDVEQRVTIRSGGHVFRRNYNPSEKVSAWPHISAFLRLCVCYNTVQL